MAPKLFGKPRSTSLQLKWRKPLILIIAPALLLVKSTFRLFCPPVAPDNNGGAPVTEFEVLQTSMDNCTREVYKGRDLECTVAGLQPGRSYLFQVRALNKAGVCSL